MFWKGEATWQSFACQLKNYFSYPGTKIRGQAVINLNGLLLAEIEFELLVAAKSSPDIAAIQQTVKSPKTAFASYASQDRITVLRSVQGIQKGAPDLDVWLDNDKLHSGDDWAEKIGAFIRTSDILYLFWSSAAAKSEWVDREWRLGLRWRGLEFINPFPLESPELAPPPPELQSLHFNDRLLIYLYGQQEIDRHKNVAAAASPA